MTDLNIPTLTNDLTPIIDENTDMNDIADIPAEITEADATQTTIGKVQFAAKMLGKGFAKLDKIELALAELGDARKAAQQRVTDVMAAGGEGFDEASRAFKQANNKFDRALDARTAKLNDLNAGIAALRGLLDDLETEIAVMLEK